jgi:cytochrome c biogenesis protein CcmG/thiol:disulfide interchange protein DsbE
LLTEPAEDKRIQLVDINYEDATEDAVASSVATQIHSVPSALTAMAARASKWGRYGASETFIVDREATIVYKLVRPMTLDNIDGVLRVQIRKAMHKAV